VAQGTRVHCTLSLYVKDKPIFWSEGILHKDYYNKGSIKKVSLVVGLKGLEAKID
jgi:hypothetical protein